MALLIGCVVSAAAQWEQVASETNSSLKDIFFTNDVVGFCVGGGDMYGFPNQEQAVILRTLDGGDTWTTVFQDSLVAVHCVSAKGDTVVCFGRSMAVTGLLWTSYDHGTSWMLDTLAWLGGNAYNPEFYGSELLFLTGQDLLRLDLATHLAETLFVANNASLFTIDGLKLFLMSMDKALHTSINGGLNWLSIPSILSDSIGSWTLSDIDEIFANGDEIAINLTYIDGVASTTNLGQNWSWYETSFGHATFASLDTIYGYGNGAEIHVSTDRGQNIALQQTLNSTIRKTFFLHGTQNGWVCGDNGMIYRTANGGFPTGVGQAIVREDLGIAVRPNPSQDQLVLSVPLQLQVESIELLDSAMKRVRTFPESSRTLDTQGVALGNYVLKVTTDRGVQSIKIILQ